MGALDDGIKIFKKRNLGLSAKQKILGQILLAAIFCYGVARTIGADTVLSVPHLGIHWDLSWGYYVWALLVIVGTTNAVNLTDGLDGLAAGTTAIASAAYVWLARGAMEPSIAVFAAAVTGVCVGFLVFNYHPARVFMGDTGSLALGAAFAGMALLTKTELLLVVVGGIFVAEALSVILQVASYKTRQKRIFRMSPLHHHFELGGWSETYVVHVFWFVGFLLAILGIVLQ